MPPELKNQCIRLAQEGLAKYSVMRDIAKNIKKTLDEKHNHAWQCIMGRHFGSYVSHQPETFAFFYIEDFAFMIFQT